MPVEPVGNSSALQAVQKVNALLAAAIPTVGLVIGAIELVKEIFRRKEAGAPELTLDEMATMLIELGEGIGKKSDEWLTEHGYGPDGKKH